MLLPLLAVLATVTLPLSAIAQAHNARPTLVIENGGHTARVMRTLFLPSGELVSMGGDKAIRIFATTGEDAGNQIRTLRAFIGTGNRGVFDAAAVSPDGKILAVCGFEGRDRDVRVRLFDVATGKITRVLTHRNNGISDLAFSPDGKRLAACSDKRDPLWFWDLTTGRVTEIKGHTEAVNQVSFLPDGRLASVSTDRSLRIWDVAGKPLLNRSHAAELRSVAASPDGKYLAVGGQDGAILLWHWEGANLAEPPLRLPLQGNPVLTLAFTADGLLVSGQGERTPDVPARVWEATTGKLIVEFTGHRTTVTTVSVSRDGQRVASADASGAVYVWPIRQGGSAEKALALLGSGRTITSVGWSTNATSPVVGFGVEPDLTQNTSPTLSRAFDLNGAAPGPLPKDTTFRGAVQTSGNRRLTLSDDRLAVNAIDGDRRTATFRFSEDRPPLTLPGGATVTRGRDMDRSDEIRAFTFGSDGAVYAGSVFSLARFKPDGKLEREFVGHTGEITALSVSPDGRYLASASRDQTMRVWDLRDTSVAVAPLLSLFEDTHGRWVTWTEAGYFAASPGGDRLIGWHVNKGEDEAAEFYTADQFWRLFYRPDVLTRVVAAGSVATAVQLADKDRTIKTDSTRTTANLTTLAPPLVTLVGAGNGVTSDTGKVTVRARISDPNGKKIAKVYVRVNDTAGRGQDFTTATAESADWSQEVALQPGENRVAVFAENETGTRSTPVYLRATYRPTVPRRPNLYVLAVGVGKYDSSGITKLDWTAKDARDFSAAFGKQQGKLFGTVEAKVLTDKDANRVGIEKAIGDLASKKPRPDDYVVIFMAGHGAPIAPEKGDREYGFLPVDAVIGKFDTTAYRGRDLLEALQAFPCHVLLMLDTCRNGSAILRADDPNLQMQYLAGQVQYGRVTILSCGPTEISEESDEWQNGAFTRRFIEGLNGAAPSLGGDASVVTLLDLEAYLTRTVPELTGGRQLPRIEVPSYIPLNKARFPLAKR